MVYQRHILNFRRLTAVIALMPCVLFPPSGGLAAQTPDAVQRQTIVSLHKTRQAVFDRLGEGASGHSDSAGPQDEARLFIAYLDGRIHHYCRQRYLNLGGAGLEGLPCPLDSAGRFEPEKFAPVPEDAGQTRKEKVAQLDRELSEALGRFDDMLLEEEETVAARIPRQAADGGKGSAVRQQQSGVGRNGDEGAEHSGAPSDKPEGAEAGMTEQKPAAPPSAGRRELEEGDDDIVARQLREAAEQETDPEVKERLWEEYRKYKEGIR